VKRPLSLGTRLALAFGGLFLVASLLTAALAAWRAGGAAEERFHLRMTSLVQAIPPSLVGNPDVMARTKRLVGVDVASYDPESRELISSLGKREHDELNYTLYADQPPFIHRTPDAYVPGPVYRQPGVGSPLRWQVFGAWQSAGEKRRLVLLVVPQEEIDRARAAAVTPILWTALVGAAAVVLLGFLLARTVARPLGRLAAEAERAAGGALAFKASAGGGREVEALSAALERTSAALLRARAEFARSERMAVAGQMAAALAHEVRNPLTSARMTVEMLLAEERGSQAAEHLRAVLDELGRLELVVDEMVSFARPTPPVFARVELPALAAEVLAFMRRQLDHAHVRAATEFDPAAPSARADRNKIKQVLVNLVLNAIQAQPRGGDLTVRVRRASGADGRVVLEVADTGSGVRPEELDKIFAPFYTTKSGGAGLGLSVSRRIAEEHGGALVCEPGGAGRGATFRLELPAWTAADS